MSNKKECIKSDFGNCGPNTEGDYCLLHKPEKELEEARDFYRYLTKDSKKEEYVNEFGEQRKRYIFKQDVDWQGFYFPQIPTKGNSTDVLFGFCQCIFQGNANFKNAHFESSAFFGISHNWLGDPKAGYTSFNSPMSEAGDHAVFEKRATFEGTYFHREAKFHHTEFNGNAHFDYARFKNGQANFVSAKFRGNTVFKSCLFERGAHFGKAAFSHESDLVNFGLARFGGSVDCSHASFTSSPYFGKAIFDEYLYFRNTYFESGAEVVTEETVSNNFVVERQIKPASNWDETKEYLLNFYSSTKYKTVELRAKEEGRQLYKEDFENGEEKQLNSFLGRAEKEIEDRDDLSLDHIEVFIDQADQKFVEDQAREEGCRVQRRSYEAEGNKEKADQMFVHEMRAKRKQKSNRWVRRLDRIVADWSCKYGTSWERVLLRAGQFIGGFALLYWLLSIFSMLKPLRPFLGTLRVPPEYTTIVNFDGITPLRGLANSVYYSAITFTTLGYGDLQPTGFLMKALSTVESVIGALFVALIIVVFARKWMRG